MSLKGRNFLTLKDFSKEEILEFLSLAEELKAKKKQGISIDFRNRRQKILIKWF